ncbi:MAG: hypothetical protein EXQ93_04520 [Alphaproteobacteria bacterium]|nr:hypothetical protein [Alphaproteobacteria bacterium]
MNLKTLALSAALVTGFVAPLAHAITVVPAAYAIGVVTAVDAARGTVTVDGIAYAATPTLLNDVTTGSQIDVAYLTVGGKLTAIAIEPTATEAGNEMAE